MEVIQGVCREKGADLTETDLSCKAVKEDFAGQTLEYRGGVLYDLSLAGSYQTENAALGLDALEVLNHKGYPTTVEQRKKGLRETKWNGRLTIIHRDPLFIVDGAHNPAAADMLEDSVRKYFKGRNMWLYHGRFPRQRLFLYYPEFMSLMQSRSFDRDAITTGLPAQELAETVRECNRTGRREYTGCGK